MTHFRPQTRRQFLETVAAGSLTLGLVSTLGTQAFAQGATTVPVDELMVESALPDIWLGKKDAPVTIIEYASVTCSHCANFATGTFPKLKEKYIDTGKVRFSLREFPFDPLAMAGFMLARCAGPEKREPLVELLMERQRAWAFTDKPFQALVALVKETGIPQETIDTCLKDKTLYEQVSQIRDRAAEKFKVDSTPTFFINGKKISGDLSIEKLEAEMAPFLKS